MLFLKVSYPYRFPSSWDEINIFVIDPYLMIHCIQCVIEYKGVPDPLRGDEIYRRVRDLAKVTNSVQKQNNWRKCDCWCLIAVLVYYVL